MADYKQGNGESNHSRHDTCNVIMKNQSLLTAYYNVKTQIQFSIQVTVLEPVTYVQYITYKARAKARIPNTIQNENTK